MFVKKDIGELSYNAARLLALSQSPGEEQYHDCSRLALALFSKTADEFLAQINQLTQLPEPWQTFKETLVQAFSENKSKHRPDDPLRGQRLKTIKKINRQFSKLLPFTTSSNYNAFIKSSQELLATAASPAQIQEFSAVCKLAELLKATRTGHKNSKHFPSVKEIRTSVFTRPIFLHSFEPTVFNLWRRIMDNGFARGENEWSKMLKLVFLGLHPELEPDLASALDAASEFEDDHRQWLTEIIRLYPWSIQEQYLLKCLNIMYLMYLVLSNFDDSLTESSAFVDEASEHVNWEIVPQEIINELENLFSEINSLGEKLGLSEFWPVLITNWFLTQLKDSMPSSIELLTIFRPHLATFSFNNLATVFFYDPLNSYTLEQFKASGLKIRLTYTECSQHVFNFLNRFAPSADDQNNSEKLASYLEAVKQGLTPETFINFIKTWINLYLLIKSDLVLPSKAGLNVIIKPNKVLSPFFIKDYLITNLGAGAHVELLRASDQEGKPFGDSSPEAVEKFLAVRNKEDYLDNILTCALTAWFIDAPRGGDEGNLEFVNKLSVAACESFDKNNHWPSLVIYLVSIEEDNYRRKATKPLLKVIEHQKGFKYGKIMSITKDLKYISKKFNDAELKENNRNMSSFEFHDSENRETNPFKLYIDSFDSFNDSYCTKILNNCVAALKSANYYKSLFDFFNESFDFMNPFKRINVDYFDGTIDDDDDYECDYDEDDDGFIDFMREIMRKANKH
ncbi:MAG: hypothetical protein LBT47_08970 [Deltaproteobacteria bacterium]|nr:hypothetical protein [Deltaproteobacteria bacterium]